MQDALACGVRDARINLSSLIIPLFVSAVGASASTALLCYLTLKTRERFGKVDRILGRQFKEFGALKEIAKHNVDGLRSVSAKLTDHTARLLELEQQLRELRTTQKKSRTLLKDLTKAVSDAQLEGGYLNSLNALPLRYPLFFGRWSIDGITAKCILDTIVERKPRVVLELGGGTSTVLIAAALQATGLSETRHIAVDHLQEFLDATQRNVQLQQLSRDVEYWCCPLLPEDDKVAPQWYGGLPERLGSTKIDLLIVDGPPGSLHDQARRPALEVLAPYLAPGAVVILDDALRDDELKIVEKWCHDIPGITVELTSFGKGCARLKLPQALHTE
jgi:hypothetical protein